MGDNRIEIKGSSIEIRDSESISVGSVSNEKEDSAIGTISSKIDSQPSLLKYLFFISILFIAIAVIVVKTS